MSDTPEHYAARRKIDLISFCQCSARTIPVFPGCGAHIVQIANWPRLSYRGNASRFASRDSLL